MLSYYITHYINNKVLHIVWRTVLFSSLCLLKVVQWFSNALFLYFSNPEYDAWCPDLTSKPSKAFSLWNSGRRVLMETYVSKESSSTEERSRGHPDWKIKSGSCNEFGVYFSDPSRIVACSHLVITCAFCYASVKLGCPHEVRDFHLNRVRLSMCNIHFICFSCHSICWCRFDVQS